MSAVRELELHVLLTAWGLADGDEERIEVVSPTEAIVWNHPLHLDRHDAPTTKD